MLEKLGTIQEIRLVWMCKPELRSRMVRYMMKHCGHPGVRALAKALGVSYRRLYEIGGIEGRLNRRNCQRRQRKKRQAKKLRDFHVEVAYEKSHISTGGGKRGKGGGLQDAGRRALIQSVIGQ